MDNLDLNKFALLNQFTRENLLAVAKEARLAKVAQPTPPSRRLAVVVAATAILLGMILVLALAL